ncbi:thiamine pyrophosphokinase [Pustulibacterium marinum]|uniref:Thiamine diphosphokinase n=1 Tax=Pustulibacterium marinum TaxID=1224947 RepID=A0A1I7I0A0_9FLAO|nr:thiamine diphosphokinase [Pustulibacterium marinum]SFU66375.1 thiamine pyrophosphokinase [Pustulibacterium marinum]
MHITRENYTSRSEVVLFINGQFPKHMPLVQEFKKIFCTDGAYHKLVKRGVLPDVVSGDFDSLSEDKIDETVEIIPTPDQNFTDFEKALQLIKNEGYKSVAVFGCSGLEHDHFLGNLHSILKFKKELNITCFDDFGFYFFAEKKTKISGFQNEIISLFPFPKAKKITSTGVKYPLTKENLSIAKRVGTRNTITAETAQIEFSKGNLLLFVQNLK